MTRLLLLFFLTFSLYADLIEDGLTASTNVNMQKASSLWEQACFTDDTRGCLLLALAYDYGDKLPQDRTKAFELYKPACKDGYVQACAKLGLMYEEGNLVKEDKKKANIVK